MMIASTRTITQTDEDDANRKFNKIEASIDEPNCEPSKTTTTTTIIRQVADQMDETNSSCPKRKKEKQHRRSSSISSSLLVFASAALIINLSPFELHNNNEVHHRDQAGSLPGRSEPETGGFLRGTSNGRKVVSRSIVLSEAKMLMKMAKMWYIKKKLKKLNKKLKKHTIAVPVITAIPIYENSYYPPTHLNHVGYPSGAGGGGGSHSGYGGGHFGAASYYSPSYAYSGSPTSASTSASSLAAEANSQQLGSPSGSGLMSASTAAQQAAAAAAELATRNYVVAQQETQIGASASRQHQQITPAIQSYRYPSASSLVSAAQQALAAAHQHYHQQQQQHQHQQVYPTSASYHAYSHPYANPHGAAQQIINSYAPAPPLFYGDDSGGMYGHYGNAYGRYDGGYHMWR